MFDISLVVLASLSKINEAIDSNDASLILACLQLTTAKLNNVRPKNAEIYKLVLKEAKKEKAEVTVVYGFISFINLNFYVVLFMKAFDDLLISI